MRIAITSIMLCLSLQLQVFASPYFFDIVTHPKNTELIVRVHEGLADFYRLSDDAAEYSFDFGLELLSRQYHPHEVHVSPDGRYLVILERSKGLAVSIYDIPSQILVKTFTVSEVFGHQGAKSGFHYHWRGNRLLINGPDVQATGYSWIFGEADSRSYSTFRINMKTLSINSETFADQISETSRNTWWTFLLGALIGCTLLVTVRLALKRINRL